MKKQKLTPWFPPEVKPVRVGIYLATVDPAETYYRMWTGSHWLTGGATVAEAKREASSGCKSWNLIYWCGLAKAPK